jgi:hypothetical protein
MSRSFRSPRSVPWLLHRPDWKSFLSTTWYDHSVSKTYNGQVQVVLLLGTRHL